MIILVVCWTERMHMKLYVLVVYLTEVNVFSEHHGCLTTSSLFDCSHTIFVFGTFFSDFFASVVPPKYFFWDSSFDSCLAHMSKFLHASLAVPALKYFHFKHSQTATARSLVGPLFSSRLRHAASGLGSRTFSSFNNLSDKWSFGY